MGSGDADARVGSGRNRLLDHAVRAHRPALAVAGHPHGVLRDGRQHAPRRPTRRAAGNRARTPGLGRSRHPRRAVDPRRARGRRFRRPPEHRHLGSRGADNQGLLRREVRRHRDGHPGPPDHRGLPPDRDLRVPRRPLRCGRPPVEALAGVSRDARAPGRARRSRLPRRRRAPRPARGAESAHRSAPAPALPPRPVEPWPECRPPVRHAPATHGIRRRPSGRGPRGNRHGARALGLHADAGTGLRFPDQQHHHRSPYQRAGRTGLR